MDFLDDVIDTAQKTGAFIKNKAVDAVDYVALEYKSSSIKTKLEEYYKILGKLAYKSALENVDTNEKQKLAIDEITKLNEQLDELYVQMSKYKNTCKNCGKSNPAKAEFCNKCGSPLK